MERARSKTDSKRKAKKAKRKRHDTFKLPKGVKLFYFNGEGNRLFAICYKIEAKEKRLLYGGSINRATLEPTWPGKTEIRATALARLRKRPVIVPLHEMKAKTKEDSEAIFAQMLEMLNKEKHHVEDYIKERVTKRLRDIRGPRLVEPLF